MNEMFCPNCGQQQVSEDVRFCSRCGFQMHVVARLLETGGALAGFEAEATGKKSLFKRITSSAGAKVMFVSVVMFIFVFFLALIANAPQFLAIPFFLFVIGAAMVIYKLLFGEKNNIVGDENFYQSKNINRTNSPNELPPSRSVPVSAYENPRSKANEIRQPPSVTEPTTKLLEPDGKTNEL